MNLGKGCVSIYQVKCIYEICLKAPEGRILLQNFPGCMNYTLSSASDTHPNLVRRQNAYSSFLKARDTAFPDQPPQQVPHSYWPQTSIFLDGSVKSGPSQVWGNFLGHSTTHHNIKQLGQALERLVPSARCCLESNPEVLRSEPSWAWC